MDKPIVIIGAGPAGLTAGLELVRAGHRLVTVLEATRDIGGISKTVAHKGNRIDIGGHRFFSKSDWVMDWWRTLMPVARPEGDTATASLAYQGQRRLLGTAGLCASEGDEQVMLLRNRLSRIYFAGKFLDYPLQPNLEMVRQLGAGRCLGFASSYAAARLRPIRPETSLEHFFINRFGQRLYRQFFKEYTEKVWGVPCGEITAEWGAQRIKSVSVGKLVSHALGKLAGRADAQASTSLIEHFLYPKRGPGQMWELAAQQFQALGGQLVRDANVVRLDRDEQRITAVIARRPDGSRYTLAADAVVSTMPIRDLAAALNPALPAGLADIAQGLQYRDFITVGVLYRRMRCQGTAGAHPTVGYPRDNWIYVQEPGVKVGRLQIFNNWSPYMVADPGTAWVGLEFFARDDDALWAMSDEALKALAVREMQQLGLADAADALDTLVVRMPKAYPGYFGTAYTRFGELREWLDGLPNLYLVGRNGMHRYNNQDHSMLSARHAVQAILRGSGDKRAIWSVNVDDSYHEEAQAGDAQPLADVRERYA